MAEEKKPVAPAPEEAPKKKAPAKKKAAAPKKPAEPKPEAAPEAAPVEEAPKKKAPAKKPAKPAAKPAKKPEPKPEPEKPQVTEARCFVRDVRVTPRKVRLVADVVRGKDVKEALGLLKQTVRAAALPIEKAIRSAAANATNNFGMNAELLYVAEIQVGDGLKIKRYRPRAKGSASGLVKRNANLLVVVKERK